MRIVKIFLFAAIVCAIMSSAGCTALFKNYGTIALNDEVKNAFENYRIDPDLNYYFSGSESYPTALIGLNKSYTLDSEFWRKIEVTPAVLRNLVSSMQKKAESLSRFQYGFAILDDKGRQIGIWYSILDVRTFVKMEDEKTVIINTPPQNTYEQFEGNDQRVMNHWMK